MHFMLYSKVERKKNVIRNLFEVICIFVLTIFKFNWLINITVLLEIFFLFFWDRIYRV